MCLLTDCPLAVFSEIWEKSYEEGKLKRHNSINNCTAGAGYGTKGCGTLLKENKGKKIETLTILPVEFAEGGTTR